MVKSSVVTFCETTLDVQTKLSPQFLQIFFLDVPDFFSSFSKILGRVQPFHRYFWSYKICFYLLHLILPRENPVLPTNLYM